MAHQVAVGRAKRALCLDRTLAALGLCLICGYFLLLARPSLDAYFTPDDCMNLYRSWIYPMAALVKANLFFFLASPFQRPLGSVFYRTVYHFVGFHAVWFHIISLAFLTANVPLTYAVARRLSGSRSAALLTALLTCYEAQFTALYFDTGYIYDVLCYFFTFAALLSYFRVRQKRGPVFAREIGIITLLYICALSSKEMAVMLPAFLLTYEAIYHPPSYTPRAIAKWLFDECRLPLILLLVAVFFVIGREIGPDTLLANAAYRPLFTWGRFLETSRGFLNALFGLDNRFTASEVLLVWGATGAVALVSGSRALRFAWIFAMVSVLPVAFLPPRGGPQYYIPLFGWALYAGVGVTLAGQWLLRRMVIGERFFWAERLASASLISGLVLLLYPHYRALGLTGLTAVTVEAPVVHSIVDQLHRLHPVIAHGSRILFLDDPYPADWLNMIFVVRLSYRDDSLTVERLKQMKQAPSEKQVSGYNLVLDYRAGRFLDGKWPRSAASGPAIVVRYNAKGILLAEAYHGANWEPVTADEPAGPGERIILKAMDLGGTNPETVSGQAFPRDPLAKVVGQVDARVNGRAAAVEERLGWPGEVNQYRVDIRVPRETESGLAKIELLENGVGSAEAMLSVRR